MKKKSKEITDYDTQDTSKMINENESLTLNDLDLALPPVAPTQVVSIRLPTYLLNQIRAKASAEDIPYQALIKHLLAKSIKKELR